MPTPTPRKKSVLFAWEVQRSEEETWRAEHWDDTYTIEIVCQNCGEVFTRTYLERQRESVTSLKKRCPPCEKGHGRRNVEAVHHISPLDIALISQRRVKNEKKLARLEKSKSPVKKACPTPGKKKFPTQYAAQSTALKASKTYRHPVRAYHCQCGMWHITVHRASNMRG